MQQNILQQSWPALTQSESPYVTRCHIANKGCFFLYIQGVHSKSQSLQTCCYELMSGERKDGGTEGGRMIYTSLSRVIFPFRLCISNVTC